MAASRVRSPLVVVAIVVARDMAWRGCCLRGMAVSHRGWSQERQRLTSTWHQLESGDPHIVAAAAEVLFSRSHVSHPNFAGNKELIRVIGAIPPLCRALRSEAWPVKYHACSALSELAFCNKNNCMAIVRTPGALDALVDILHSNVLNMHEDAALVVNNCAAFSEEVCMAIVQCPGMITSLKKLAISGSFGAKCVAVGALNCLSRCREAKVSLTNKRVVEDALVPVLQETGTGDKYEARKVRAAMAVANLTGRCDPQHVNEYAALPAMVRVLGYALDGRSWAGIHLSAYSVLYPLSHLAEEASNRPQLIDSGLVELLVRSVDRWSAGIRTGLSALDLLLRCTRSFLCANKPSHSCRKIRTDRCDMHTDADELTLPLVLKIGEQLARDWAAHESLRQAGILRGLREIARGLRGEAWECVSCAQKLLERLMLAPIAVCMGQHPRLGVASPFFLLDEYVSNLIVEMSFEGPDLVSTTSMYSSSGGSSLVDFKQGLDDDISVEQALDNPDAAMVDI